MPNLQVYQVLGGLIWLVFVFALGACVGSLINVLVYRLPRGLSVVTPPSRCPSCDTILSWRENIPVLGWIRLRGRCRFCRSPISPEYPLVEAFVGLLFVAFFVLWYTARPDWVWLGVHWGEIRPEWALGDARDGWPRTTWPIFIVLLTLLATLTAMTIVDAKTFTIPLVLPHAATVVGILGHTAFAVFLSTRGVTLRHHAPGWAWAIPTPGGSDPGSAQGLWWTGASLGGIVGLGAAMLLLRFGLIRRSFADYDEWEKQAIPDSAPAAATPNDGPDTAATVTSRRGLAAAVLAVVLVFVAAAAATTIRTWDGVPVWSGPLAGLLAGPIIAAAVLRRFNRGSSDSAASPAHAWIQYPHARREMFKELAFLAPCVVLGYLGGTLASGLSASPPLWLVVLAGTLMGYLIGGGVVWAIRIFGSLFFGKEAMGLGDVHLMAAVGACVGWIDATLAFPLAAVVGLYSVVVSRVASGNLARAMPFGPYLAAATVLVLLCKPLIEQGLTYLLAIPPDLPGVNIP